MTVTDLSSVAAAKAAQRQADRLRHPSSLHTAPLPLIIDPAAALTQIARNWDRLHRDLTAGPGALDDDSGWEVLQVMLGALVHPMARAGLVLTWPQLLQALRAHDQVMDGDLVPADLSCLTVAEALARTCAELDWHLYPLLHGLPARDACTECVRTCASVNAWQTRLGCTNHQTGRAQ